MSPKPRRQPVIVHTEYPSEAAAVEMVSLAPDRQGNAFLRAVIMLGYYDMMREAALQEGSKMSDGSPKLEA